MAEFIRSFDPRHGIATAETTPADQNALYASAEELDQLYGCVPTEADIRAAMVAIHAHCNRPSLWPTEYAPPPLTIPRGRQEFRLPVTPVIKLLDISARFAYGRRDQQGWNMNQAAYGALLMMTGGQPQWSVMNPDTCEVDPATGVVFLSNSLWFQPFSLVRVRFIAGYVHIPDRVKLCLFEIINNLHAKGVSDRISYGVGRVSRRYASDSFMTPFAKELLEPFVIRSLY